VWSTYPLNECPADQWAALDTEALAVEAGVPFVLANGPRYWLIDAVERTDRSGIEQRTFGTIDMNRYATVVVPDATAVAQRYVPRSVDRRTVFVWNAGSAVYELADPEGRRYVMQSWSQQVDPQLDETGLAVLAEPIVAVLFLHGKFTWHDVQQTAQTVTTASFGLVFGTSVRGTLQVFYALEDRKTPVWISIVVVVVNFALGTTLMRLGFGVAGLSFTLSISTAVQAIVLMVFVRKKIGALGVVDVVKAGVAKLGIALVAVGAAAVVARMGDWSMGTTLHNLVVVAAAIGLAVVLYGVGAALLRVRGADVIADKVARRLRRRR
jgi:hypothetical protein